MTKDLFTLSFVKLCQIPLKQLHEDSSETLEHGDSTLREECLIVTHALAHMAQSYEHDEQWHRAHGLVQNTFSTAELFANWTHALLHKIEGDLGNAQYWYNRSGKQDQFGTNYAKEAEAIWQGLAELAQAQ